MESGNNSTLESVPDVRLREQFVQNLNGSTMLDVMSHLSQVPLFVFIATFVELCILNRMNINVYKPGPFKIFNALVVFSLEFLTIIIPQVLMFTVLSDYTLAIFISTIAVIFGIIIQSVSSPDECIQYWKLPHSKGSFFPENLTMNKQPFITYFRSLTFLVTSISILAVDFHAFPRRFAKTETFGVSLMDIGVGLFIFANAVVVKQNTLIAKKLNKSLLESCVYFILGIVRYFLIQRLNYQKHVTEYGVHWNFFITLGFVKILSHILLKVFKGYSLVCGFLIIVTYQYFLGYVLEAFVLSNLDRNEWLHANREGIVSLCGYLSLYLIGVGLLNFVSEFNKSSSLNDGKTKIRLLMFLVLISTFLFAILYWFEINNMKVSRRLANLPYIVWVTAVGITLLAITLAIELLSTCFLPVKPHLKSKIYELLTPVILESINLNGLMFFLVSNFLTGIVNIFIDVLNLGTYHSIIILLTYIFVNCLLVFILNLSNIQAKIW